MNAEREAADCGGVTVYEDWNGDRLDVFKQADDIRVAIGKRPDDDYSASVDVPFADVRKVTAAMHEKAGLPDRWAELRKLLERDVALYADQWKDSEAEDMQTVLGYMAELEAGR
jgi:hypothetical protein